MPLLKDNRLVALPLRDKPVLLVPLALLVPLVPLVLPTERLVQRVLRARRLARTRATNSCKMGWRCLNDVIARR